MNGTRASHGTAVTSVTRPTVRVLVADGQPLYRDALARVVRQRAAFRLVAEHDEGRAALAAIEALAPRVAVIDEDLPGLPGTRVLRAVVRDGLPTSVVLLAAEIRPDAAYAALAAGAAGYLPKRATAAELEDAIHRTARGETVIAPAVQGGVVEEIRMRARREGPVLSPREHEILALISTGLSAPEIGRGLHLGTATVKSHIKNLYAKLGVTDRAAAVAVAMRHGLLE